PPGRRKDPSEALASLRRLAIAEPDPEEPEGRVEREAQQRLPQRHQGRGDVHQRTNQVGPAYASDGAGVDARVEQPAAHHRRAYQTPPEAVDHEGATVEGDGRFRL